MPTVTVSSGWTPAENYFKQADGAYPVTLIGIGATNEQGTFIPGATYEHNGQYGLKVKQSWRFQLDNGEVIEQGVTAPKEGRIHPNSTFYAYASALVGKQPGPGVSFETDALIGLRGLAFIQRDDNDIPRITTLGALRNGATAPQAPAPTVDQPAPPAAAPAQPAAAAGAAVPLREQVAPAAAPDGLPF
jgi:hypothetical protein